ASNGTSPYTFTLSAGSLPSGLSLNTNTGAISGTPDTQGSATFTVKATDKAGSSNIHQYTVTINAPVAITTTTLRGWSPNIPNYNQTVQTSGGTAPLTFKVFSGSLPTGLSLSSTGAITGTPTAQGTFTFTVKVTDAHGSSAKKQYTVTI